MGTVELRDDDVRGVVLPFKPGQHARANAAQAATLLEQDRADTRNEMRETHKQMLLGQIRHHREQLAMYEAAYEEHFGG
jgi:hypothetical protein